MVFLCFAFIHELGVNEREVKGRHSTYQEKRGENEDLEAGSQMHINRIVRPSSQDC